MLRTFRQSALLLAAFLLSGCVIGGEPGTPTRTVITFAGRETERQAYAPLISAFNVANPDVQVQFVALDWSAPVVGAAANEPNPQLRQWAMAADTASLTLLPDEATAGYLHDLAPFVAADASVAQQDFRPGAIAAATRDQTLVLLPRTLHVPLLSYNKALWAARGLPPPTSNWTWRDLVAAAQQLAHNPGAPDATYGLLDPQLGTLPLRGELQTLLDGQGRETVRLDRPEIAAVVERMRELSATGALLLPFSVLQRGSTDDFKPLILQQHVGMWPVTALYLNPNDRLDFPIGTVPLPPVAGPVFDAVEGYGMSNATRHPQESWRWLSFLSRQQLAVANAEPPDAGAVSARISLEAAPTTSGAETHAAVQAVLDRAATTAATTDARLFAPLQQALVSVLRGERTPEQALADAQARVQQPSPEPAAFAVATPLPAPPPGAVTISYANIMGRIDEVDKLARAFTADHPEIIVETKRLDGIGSSTLASLAKRADCFPYFSAPRTSELTATLNLQPFIDADKRFALDDYPAAVLAPYRYQGGLYGVPLSVLLRFVAYNKDLFDVAGLAPPSAAWTLDDFETTAQKLTSGAGDARRYGFASTAPPSDLFFFLDHAGVKTTRGAADTLEPNFTDPAVQKAIARFIALMQATSPNERFGGYTVGDTANPGWDSFAGGRTGMIMSQATGMDRPGGFTLALAPPPLGAGPVTVNDVEPFGGLFIAAQSPHPEACWAWLTYLSHQLAAMPDGFPARSSLATGTDFTRLAPAGSEEVYKAYQAVFARPLPAEQTWETFAQGPIDYFWLFGAVDRAMDGADLQQELEEAQTRTTQFLACVRSEKDGVTCARQVDPAYKGWQNADAKR